MRRSKWDKPFKITSVCREDIIIAFEGTNEQDRIKNVVGKITDAEMAYIARKLADDYCEQLFWDSLRIIFEDRFMEKGRDNHEPNNRVQR